MKILISYFCIFYFGICARAQLTDSLKIGVGFIGTAASKEYQPLWIVSNRFGTIEDRKSDVTTCVSISNFHYLVRRSDDSLNQPYIQYKVNLFSNNRFRHRFFEEAYLKAGFKNWQIRIGRFEEISGDVDKELSSGSLGISGNALPIPKVSLAVVDYTPIPYTKGWFQFKGQMSHGWFGNNRYMKDAFYHEKIFYMRFGKRKLKIYGGVQHFGEWGGRRGNRQLEKSWKGFVDVLFLKEVDDGSATGRPYPNRAGDQRGLLEMGLLWENENIDLAGYQQTPFDSGLEVDFRNIDRLVGLRFLSKKNTVIRKIVCEFLTTKDMFSFLTPGVRQSLYNNGSYKTGWVYEDKIIGTPLFVNRNRGSKYFSLVKPYNWDAPDSTIFGNSNVIVNRIVSGHFGIIYTLFKKLQVRTLLTYTQNYGRYGQTATSDYKNQWYTLQEFSYMTPKHISLIAGVGFDNGEFSNNLGFTLGVRKEFRYFKRR